MRFKGIVHNMVYKASQTLPPELRILAPLSQNSAEYLWTIPTAIGLKWIQFGEADKSQRAQVEDIVSRSMKKLAEIMGLKPETAATVFTTPDANKFIYFANTPEGFRVCMTGWGFRYTACTKPSEIKVPETQIDTTAATIEIRCDGIPSPKHKYEIILEGGVRKQRITDSSGCDNLGKVKVGSRLTLVDKEPSSGSPFSLTVENGKSLYTWNIVTVSEKIGKEPREEKGTPRKPEPEKPKPGNPEPKKPEPKKPDPREEKGGEEPVKPRRPRKEGRRTPPRRRIPTPVPGKSTPIVNPVDPVKYIDSSRLMVLINPGERDREAEMERFKREFKQVYPAPTFMVEFADVATMLVSLAIPSTRRIEVRNSLNSRMPDIDFYIEYVEIVGLPPKLNLADVRFDKDGQWYYDAVQTKEAWKVTEGEGIKVAVVDDYFDLGHINFENLKIEESLSLENATDDVSPLNPEEHYHGTHVLGTVAAQLKDDGMNIVGISPAVSVIPISLGEDMTTFKVLYAILYALYRGVQVINLSLGPRWSDEIKSMSEKEQVEYAASQYKESEQLWDYVYAMLDARNCTVVYSSGNESLYTLLDSKKRYDNILIVDAVDSSLSAADFTNYANLPFLDIHNGVVSAPGVRILNLVPENKYAFLGGTSMAAPIVTAAVALMKSVDPSLSNSEVKHIIKSTAKPLEDPRIGPLIQIGDALDMVKGMRGGWKEFYRQHIGIWKTTDKYSVCDVDTGEWEADCHQYIIFHTHDSGVVELHALGENRIWNSRFKARLLGDRIVMEFEPQKDMNGVRYVPDKIELRPDESDNVLLTFYAEDKANDKSHYIRHIEKDDRRNTNRRDI